MVCWVPLVDVSATNSMMLVPESHKRMLPGEIEDNAYKVIRVIQDDQFVSVVANAGDIVLMTGWTMQNWCGWVCWISVGTVKPWEDASEPYFVERNIRVHKYVHRK